MKKSLLGKSLLCLLFAAETFVLSAHQNVAGPAPFHREPMGRMHRKPVRREFRSPFFEHLTNEERAQIEQLARAGKKAELRILFHKLMLKYRPPELQKLDELSRKYLNSKDDKEKAAIKAEMIKQERICFQKRQECNKANIVHVEKQLQMVQMQLDRLKKHYQNCEQKSEEIIAAHVEQLCLPPEKRKPLFKQPAGKPEMPPPASRPIPDQPLPPPAQ